MRIFSVTALVISLATTVFGAVEGNSLLMISSLIMCFGFIFLYFYAKNRSERLMNLFALCLGIYVVLILVRIFTEKGYF